MKPRRNEEAQAHIGLSSHSKKNKFVLFIKYNYGDEHKDDSQVMNGRNRKKTYKILVGKHEQKTQFGCQNGNREIKIKLDLKDEVRACVDCINMAQFMDL
jgi:hypothetical protein